MLKVKAEEIAMIIYGQGGELGNFEVFAKTLHKDLIKKHTSAEVKFVTRDNDFFSVLNSIPVGKKLSELHIFSHSIGAGLFLGYKDPLISNQREFTYRKAQRDGRKVTYSEAVKTETGAIQTDDFYLSNITAIRDALRKKFTNTAFIKIWGCNS
ncbi:MAG: hypothetical protein COA42_17130, partial [Alteromonadaceae bacterium]